ncbi:hypothetical protein BDC45DRAFT_172674 [Circinella umbellata]|nr:hypothetical protein BDC45DRAFT_172674 [Circinella umbellata]
MSNNNNNVAAPPLPPRNALSSDNLAPPDLPPRNTRPRSSSDTTAIRFSSFQHSPSTLSNVVDGDNTTTSSNLTPETKPIDNHKNNNKRNSNNSADAMAAAYLERHVREMKRASVAGLARPIRRNYEKRNEEDGSVQVNWKEYFEAVKISFFFF